MCNIKKNKGTSMTVRIVTGANGIKYITNEPFKPDYNTEAVLVEEMQRMAKRIEDLEIELQQVQYKYGPESFQIYLPLYSSPVNNEKLPWVYDQDRSSGNVASILETSSRLLILGMLVVSPAMVQETGTPPIHSASRCRRSVRSRAAHAMTRRTAPVSNS